MGWWGWGEQWSIFWPCWVCSSPPTNTHHQIHHAVHPQGGVLRIEGASPKRLAGAQGGACHGVDLAERDGRVGIRHHIALAVLEVERRVDALPICSLHTSVVGYHATNKRLESIG